MNEPNLPTQFVTDTDIDAVLIAGRYTLLDQSADQTLLGAAASPGVHVIAAGVYNSGSLTGVETNLYFDYAAAPAEIVARARRLQSECDGFGVSLPAAAVQFVVRHRAVGTVLLGARSRAVGTVLLGARSRAVGTVLLGARSRAEAAENWSHAHAGLPDDLWPALGDVINEADDVD